MRRSPVCAPYGHFLGGQPDGPPPKESAGARRSARAMDEPATDQRIDDLQRHVSTSREGAESAAQRADRALARLHAIERLMSAFASAPVPARANAPAGVPVSASRPDPAEVKPRSGRRASMRDGPLADLFRATDERAARPRPSADRGA
jgi:hypothetical protein